MSPEGGGFFPVVVLAFSSIMMLVISSWCSEILCGMVSVRQALEYVEIEIHERTQDGEAEYIWLHRLKYRWNEENRIFYIYHCTSGNSLQENPTKTNKQTPEQTPSH